VLPFKDGGEDAGRIDVPFSVIDAAGCGETACYSFVVGTLLEDAASVLLTPGT
jgi:hypothetical protein